MQIRCKFRVRSIERILAHHYNHETKENGTQEVRTIKFDVSYDPKFHGMTPSGVIELCLVKEEHARHFKLGAEYFADFSPVVPPVEALTGEAG